MASAYIPFYEVLREVLRDNPERNFGDDFSSERDQELSYRQESSESKQELEEDHNSSFSKEDEYAISMFCFGLLKQGCKLVLIARNFP